VFTARYGLDLLNIIWGNLSPGGFCGGQSGRGTGFSFE
jgi:hypothetical protein